MDPNHMEISFKRSIPRRTEISRLVLCEPAGICSIVRLRIKFFGEFRFQNRMDNVSLHILSVLQRCESDTWGVSEFEVWLWSFTERERGASKKCLSFFRPWFVEGSCFGPSNVSLLAQTILASRKITVFHARVVSRKVQEVFCWRNSN